MSNISKVQSVSARNIRPEPRTAREETDGESFIATDMVGRRLKFNLEGENVIVRHNHLTWEIPAKALLAHLKPKPKPRKKAEEVKEDPTDGSQA